MVGFARVSAFVRSARILQLRWGFEGLHGGVKKKIGLSSREKLRAGCPYFLLVSILAQNRVGSSCAKANGCDGFLRCVLQGGAHTTHTHTLNYIRPFSSILKVCGNRERARAAQSRTWRCETHPSADQKMTYNTDSQPFFLSSKCQAGIHVLRSF